MIKSPKHSWIVASLVDWLRANLGSSFHVRQEQPLTLADSEPEPDVAVVAGGVDDFRHQHPTTAKLVIEVALSSEELDREKVGIYAEADVDEYWIILADQRQVEVYTQPSASGYARMHCHQCNEVITATVLPVLTLPLGRILS
jgi:Uma2 family endonuclease